MCIVHYLNQFFGRLGGEAAADAPPRVLEGPIGPGVRLHELLRARAADAGVVATVVCGDNFAAEQPTGFGLDITNALRQARADVVVAGPAFDAGRYGLACGAVCCLAAELGIPSVTAMSPDNPAVSLHRSHSIIVPTAGTAVGMQPALAKLTELAVRLAQGEALGAPWVDGYLPQGFRRVDLREQSAAERTLDMLASRLRGAPFQTEIPLPDVDRVEPAAPVTDLTTAVLAVVTTSAMVPKGNPDRLRQSYSTEWRSYSIEGLERLAPGEWESIHGGFDTSAANADPHQVVPLDALRSLEGTRYGRLLPTYFVTAGVGTAVSAAKRMGAEIAAELLRSGVQGVILTAT